LLLHASKEVDKDCFVSNEINLDFFEQFGSEVVDVLPRYKREYALGSLVGQADLVDVVEESESQWFCGPYGFVLKNARPIEPLAYRGALKLFDVPKSILDPAPVTLSLGPCAVCGGQATVASPSGNPESVYCKKCGCCSRCKGSIEKFVKYPHGDFYVCPCVASSTSQTSLIEETKQANQVQLAFEI
jgi:hypothetical protein